MDQVVVPLSNTYLNMIKDYECQVYWYVPRLCQQDVKITLRHTFDILICVYYEIISLATVRVKRVDFHGYHRDRVTCNDQHAVILYVYDCWAGVACAVDKSESVAFSQCNSKYFKRRSSDWSFRRCLCYNDKCCSIFP